MPKNKKIKITTHDSTAIFKFRGRQLLDAGRAALVWVPAKVAFHVSEVNGLNILTAGSKKDMQIVCNEK